MKNTYSKTPLHVKPLIANLQHRHPPRAGYTVRLGGSVWRIRATHLELLKFLRHLRASRSAA